MNHSYKAWMLLLGITVLFSSCFLFNKAPRKTPPPPEQAPQTEQPAAPVEKPETPEEPVTHEKAGPRVLKIALLTPLYIDQVTRDTGFSVSNLTPLPANSLAGLEFYEGALLAQDSLREEGIYTQLQVHDTKSTSRPLARILSSGALDSVNLILGAVSGAELREVSQFARKHSIHFVSATYPNDGGVSDNPFLTILNSTLRVHCEAIQHFVQQKFTNKNIIVIYQDNAQERQNLAYLQRSYQTMGYGRKSPLKPFVWDNDMTTDKLVPLLSKEKNNVIIITALYPQVAESIIGQLVELSQTYTLNIVGMPTLDGDANLRKNTYKGVSIYYATPFPYSRAADNAAINRMMWAFFQKYRGRPSDMAMKGYESMFYCGKLLDKGAARFNTYMTQHPGTLLSRFEIKPVFINGGGNQKNPDYFENMQLYFMQIRDGKVIPAN